MRFLRDVHIPIRLSKRLSELGHDSRHVNSLPDRWLTSDREIARFADREDRILISKDSDFRNSCVVQGTPRKLIKVNLGNLSHRTLSEQLCAHLVEIERLDALGRFLVELDQDRITRLDLPSIPSGLK